MMIFDETNNPIILESIYAPTPTEHMWVLDLDIKDFTIVPIETLEEITCPTLTVEIMGFGFDLPAHWFVLVVDEETTQLDMSRVGDLAGKDFSVLVYGPELYRPKIQNMKVIDYSPTSVNVGPSLNKNQQLCHPISPTEWINIAPSDSYNKYLKHMLLGDLI